MLRFLTAILTFLWLTLLALPALAQEVVTPPVPFDGTSLAQLLGSGVFAIAVTALMRRAWPSIDGLWNWLVVGVLSIGSTVLLRHAASIPPIVWEIGGPLAALLFAVGWRENDAQVAKKAKSVTIVAPRDPEVTVGDPVIKPAPARDTDPGPVGG
jgi:hypothetical protein